MSLSGAFVPTGFGSLAGWPDDDHASAFAAFRRGAVRALEKPYRTGSLGVDAAAFEPAFAEARLLDRPGNAAARAFFERHFVPALITASDGGPGLVTGFYEPEVEASPVRTPRHGVPLLSRPDDLVDVDDADRPAGFDPALAFARRGADGLEPYFDRAAIECGALDGRGLEIAWLESRVDAFFIHVQGAARLVFPDGAVRRITYAAKTGHPFTGPGGRLVAMGEIAPDRVSMQTIRRWLADNPGRVDEILRQNRSYIFFREAPVDDPALGPVAAAKVPLTPGRSIAVDRLLHTFATPFFIDAPRVMGFSAAPFSRLMIAQDTGSAIVGPARADLFAGSGAQAGEIAGVIRCPATFHALLPKTLTGGRL
ncbi:MAG: murein transglycosylase A [Rhizobiaceae bacterium]